MYPVHSLKQEGKLNDDTLSELGRRGKIPQVEIELLLTAYCLSDVQRLDAWLQPHGVALRDGALTWLLSKAEQGARAKHLLQLTEFITSESANKLTTACRESWRRIETTQNSKEV